MEREETMRITLNSVLVDDQEKALAFYTEVLGFEKKTDLRAGEFRWLTVVSPEQPDGTQLVLEPNVFPAAATYQKALFDSGIPFTSFEVDDVAAEFERLKQRGVVFKTEPTDVGTAIIATFEDNSGNLLQIHTEKTG
jgi:catechol 2,3-dioxygenase-like lactoylglutathione lyase family enzyme